MINSGGNMKTILCMLLVFKILSAGTLKPPTFSEQVAKLEAMLKQKGPGSTYSFQNKQALEKFIANIANHYGLDKTLLLGIVKQESAYCRFKLNKITGDAGCMQIHKGNIKAHGWNKSVIMNHDAANIVAGALVLLDFRKEFKAKEPRTWACRYNIGYRNMPAQCLTYLNKIYALK